MRLNYRYHIIFYHQAFVHTHPIDLLGCEEDGALSHDTDSASISFIIWHSVAQLIFQMGHTFTAARTFNVNYSKPCCSKVKWQIYDWKESEVTVALRMTVWRNNTLIGLLIAMLILITSFTVQRKPRNWWKDFDWNAVCFYRLITSSSLYLSD